MASAGWYPDPGGQPGMYRYWDGQSWSAALSASPTAAPPHPELGQPTERPADSAADETRPTAYQSYRQQAEKKRPIGWWIGGGLGVIAIIVVVVLLIRTLGGGTFGGGNDPGGPGSANPCPTTTFSASAGADHPNDGRVHGGPLSYPRLGAPWSAPHGDDRVPFGSDIQSQTVVTETYGYKQQWLAGVLIAQLIAGDGFFTPQQGSQIVAKCVVGTFYGDNPVQRHDLVSKATKVDGRDAWYLKSHLQFDIKGLQAKGETMIIVIINVGAISGLYYASIPDNAKQYQADADKVLDQLTVD
ncbi:DUF2510 domain-containing protein [Microlunatus elymi]|uniref:DUF2510 domain-containing protein n=1 Tax=Microlunatus elymi TaxID=2596828 RepID=A0A516Q4E6_9ACTN|nr:DUF2510 domain-containing protein [Microlunatus elymi]QDP98255.1 DUF2510 domain-containing protein [Microlunatus elymi]